MCSVVDCWSKIASCYPRKWCVCSGKNVFNIDFVTNEWKLLQVTYTKPGWVKLKECGFTGRFDLFWLQSAACVWKVYHFWLCTFHQITLLTRGCRSGLGLFFLCPLPFLLQLVITPHQLNLCSTGFLYKLGKGIWKLSNVVVTLKVQNYRIHLVSMNSETKFSFMFGWGKGQKTKMNLLVLLPVATDALH